MERFTLATMAMHWAQRCVFEHGQPYGDPQAHGQNIWAHSDQTLTPEQVVQDWFDEKKFYNYDNWRIAVMSAVITQLWVYGKPNACNIYDIRHTLGSPMEVTC